MTGTLTAPGYQINDANTKISEGSNNSVRIQTNSGYVDIGPQNTGWAHFNTDRPEFYFSKPVEAEGMLKIYNTGTYLTGTEGKIAGNKVWHAGNDGSGSGLDADLLDGKHWSDIQNYINDKHNPNKKIYFVAQRSPSQYIAWENKADLTIEEDPYNCFNIDTDRFIAPREGLYFFGGVGSLNPGKGAHIFCFFKVNGNILPKSQFSTETGEASNRNWDWQSHTSTILHLKTGDYVELWFCVGGWNVSKIVFYGIEL